MAAGGDAGESEPARPHPPRPTFLELFFDLAFVFAMIALSRRMVDDLTWSEAGRTVVLLLAFTLIWALTAWTGDAVDLGRSMAVPQLIGTMAASLLLAGATADAYGGHGPLFAVTYVVVHLGTGVYYQLVLPEPAARLRSRRILFWECAAAVPWLVGGFVAGTARPVLWAVGVAVEYAGVVLGWPTPWSWRRLPRTPRRGGERISERYRQFVIIALGASLFVTGEAYSGGNYTISRTQALVVAFLTTVLLWRIYIHRAGELMTSTIAESKDPLRLSQLTAFIHLVIVTGILGTAVTSQLVIARPFGHTPSSWAAVILGGPVLFVIGRLLLGYTVFAQPSWAQTAGLLLIAGLVPATPLLAPVTLALVVTVVLAAIAAANVLELRTRRLRLARR